jgi:Flp pilus assembly protein TadB
VNSVLVAIIAAIPGIAVALAAWRKSTQTTQSTERVGAGQLALNIAKQAASTAENAERRVADLERWRGRVMKWWPLHRDWDEAMETTVRNLVPDAEIPPQPSPPFYDD